MTGAKPVRRLLSPRFPTTVAALLTALTLFLGPSRAAATDVISFRTDPGRAYYVDWSASGRGARINVAVRPGSSSVDHFMQVAPRGGVLAECDPSSRLVLLAPSGAELWHREGRVSAFRFSPDGSELAIGADTGLEILQLAGLKAKTLGRMPGTEWLRWVEGGLLARTREELYAIDKTGNKRVLGRVPAVAVVAASARRLVYFARGTWVDVDVATGRALSVTKLADRAPVIDAEISPDGTRILFATAKHVFLIDGRSPPKALSTVKGLQSLHFSPDGSSYLWAAWSGGALISNGKTIPLPSRSLGARYREDGGVEIVVTSMDGVLLWNPFTAEKTAPKNISSAEGTILAADYFGGADAVFLMRWPSNVKKRMVDDDWLTPESREDF